MYNSNGGNIIQGSLNSFGKRLSPPINLYGFEGRSLSSVIGGVRRFGLACLYNPFVLSYSNTETCYKRYLERELVKRQIDYIENLKKESKDYQTAVNSLNKCKLSAQGLHKEELKLEKLLELVYGGCDLKFVPSELLKNTFKTDNFKDICKEGEAALKDLYKKFPVVKESHIEDCLNEALMKVIREKKTITVETIENIKNIEEKELKWLLTPASRQANMENIVKENFLFELVCEGWLFVSEVLWGEFGICLFHNDLNQVLAFWRLSATIAGICLTMPIFRGLLNSLWEISAASGTTCALKTWGALFEKVVTDVQDSWKIAANNVKDFHPFVSAILDTAIIMVPWAALCYYGMGDAHYMYACMDVMFLIKSRILIESFPDVKEIGEYFAIGLLRGYFKHCLMPKNDSFVRMVAHDNVFTVISVVLGKVMHILYPFGNAAKPEGLK